MQKINIKHSCVISLYDKLIDPDFHNADILLVLVEYKDKMGLTRFKQILTSKIISKYSIKDKLEITTLFGHSYVIDSKFDTLDITVTDFVVNVSDQFTREDELKVSC